LKIDDIPTQDFPDKWGLSKFASRVCIFKAEGITVALDKGDECLPIAISSTEDGLNSDWLSLDQVAELRNSLTNVLQGFGYEDEPIQAQALQPLTIDPAQPLIINVQVVTSQ
jgi:hypothetical protein